MSGSGEALHPIERALLKALGVSRNSTVETLCANSGLDIDQVRRGVEWLKFKKLVSICETVSTLISLTDTGVKAAESGLPERRLVDAIKSGMTAVDEIVRGGTLQKDEANAAVAAAKRNGWIKFGQGGKLSLAMEGDSLEERLLKKLLAGPLDLSVLSEEEKTAHGLLARRPGYIHQKEIKDTRVSLTEAGVAASRTEAEIQVRKLTPEMITSGSWKNAKLSSLDVEAPAPTLFPGRRHPLVDIIEEIKEIFVGLGFEEIDRASQFSPGSGILTRLYIPQDHSAREMQDTFYVSGVKYAR